MIKFLPHIFFLILSSCSHFNRGEAPVPQGLDGAIASSLRDENNVKRDRYQHPKETLNFFGISPEMTVVEVSPGAGYYTEILAPYLAEKGQYVMAVPRLPSRPSAFLIENERKLQDILLRYKEVQAKSRFIPFEPLDKRNKLRPGFADLVVTFNSVHNWIAKKSAPASFKFFYDILKKGGVLGVVQHRIAENKRMIPMSGYLTEREVIALARAAGFKLAEKSEINANPKDTADYPKGVWTLPPTYRLGEVDKDRYEDIGESDKMTLKFIRP
jgi:predicted methyltransferase